MITLLLYFFLVKVNDLHFKSFVNQLFVSTRTQGHTVNDCIGTKSPGNKSGSGHM